ncbi:MAG: nucleotidyltransferase domain-containing protein [Proteobacteria bacterium]|nr:nucleotidyltransferase domain-containing protein [Pseudomonadota bacterium]
MAIPGEIMTTIQDIQEIVSRLAKEYGAERVYLFGSYARGEATEQSDIDLRIDKGEIRGLRFAGLLGDLEEALGNKVDLISTAGMDEQFLEAIRPDEMLLYERN